MPPQRNERASLRITNLTPEVDEDLLWELCIQFGPVVSVHMPKDKQSGQKFDYAFVEFKNAADAEYMTEALTMTPIKLYNKTIEVQISAELKKQFALKRGREEDEQDVSRFKTQVFEIGAKIVVRNLDKSTTADDLTHLFGQFGKFAHAPRMIRNDQGEFRGAAIISYDSFEASDAAIAAMNNNAFKGRTMHIEYADRPDGRGKHGSVEERERYSAHKSMMQKMEKEEADKEKMSQAAAAAAPVPSWAQGLNPYSQL